MTKLKALLTLGLLATGIQASPIFYLVTQGNGTNTGSCPVGPCGSSLGTVDFVNGTYLGFNTVTGLQGGEEIFDIAVNSLGEIYGVSATRLYRISTAGAATFLGLHNSGTLNGLTFLNSTLYGVGTNSTLYTLDTSSGVGTSVGNFTGFASAGDVGFVGNRLFVATSSHQIIEINPNTGAVVGAAGPLNLGASNVQALKGLSTDGTDLYLAADFFGGGSNPSLVRVDINVGAGFGTVLSSIQLNGIGALGNPAGLTEFVGVPEPSALLLSILGLGLIGLGRSKRKS